MSVASEEDLHGHLLSNLCWNPPGSFIAGSYGNVVNIWQVDGESEVPFSNVCDRSDETST